MSNRSKLSNPSTTRSVSFVLAALLVSTSSTALLTACSDDTSGGGSTGGAQGGSDGGSGNNEPKGGDTGGSTGGSTDGGSTGGAGGSFVEEVTNPTGNSALIEVLLADGTPVAGATVKLFVEGSDTPSNGTTSATGGVLFQDLAAGNYVAWLSANGYVTTSTLVEVVAGTNVAASLLAVPRASAQAFDSSTSFAVSDTATSNGVSSVVTLALLPGATPADLKASVNAVDPATAAQLWGTTASNGGSTTLLELGPAFEASVEDATSGEQVQPGVNYSAELTLSDAGTLALSEESASAYALYRFDPDQAAWQEAADVLSSSGGFPTDGEWSADISHFSGWAAGRGVETACVDVTLTTSEGAPVAAVSVYSTGKSYNGKYGPVRTNAEGHACVPVKKGGTANVFATSAYGGPSVEVTAANTVAACGLDTCIEVALELNVACIPGATATCETGGAGTCAAGTKTCTGAYTWSDCAATNAAPSEVCGNQLDDNCDGQVDEDCGCIPVSEDCATSADEDCDGSEATGQQGTDNECICTPEATATCYVGPEGTQGVGTCVAGALTCAADGKSWSGCVGYVAPVADACNDEADNDCDGVANDGCACASGYSGAVPNCEDVDECEASPCESGFSCANTEGSYTCTNIDECAVDACGSGFTCEDTDGSYACSDIDECEASPCESGFSCANTEGSYTCTNIDECALDACGSGFTCEDTVGAYLCNDINECELETDQCSDDANCENNEGDYNCACNEGYDGDGYDCTDIDECELDPCESGFACSNTPGSFSCENIDECALDLDNCDANAACADTDGGFSCTCNEGYEGDGATCTAVVVGENCLTPLVDDDGDSTEGIETFEDFGEFFTYASAPDDDCSCMVGTTAAPYVPEPLSGYGGGLVEDVEQQISCSTAPDGCAIPLHLTAGSWTFHGSHFQANGQLALFKMADSTCEGLTELACVDTAIGGNQPDEIIADVEEGNYILVVKSNGSNGQGCNFDAAPTGGW